MTTQLLPLIESAEDLRAAFDKSFAEPARRTEAELEQFVAVRCAGQPLTFRIVDVVRLEIRPTIVALPGAQADLLGIAGIQGRLVPVYSLVSLLGIERGDPDWRWIAVCGTADPFGLAFGTLEVHFSVPRSSLLDLKVDGAARGHVRHGVPFEGEVRKVVEVPSIEAAIRDRDAVGGRVLQTYSQERSSCENN